MSAWQRYVQSQEYRAARQPETLGGSNHIRQTYLENRLRNAFDAGWNAAGGALAGASVTCDVLHSTHGSSATARCKLPPGHDGRHADGDVSWPAKRSPTGHTGE